MTTAGRAGVDGGVDSGTAPGLTAVAALFGEVGSLDELRQLAATLADAVLGMTGCRIVAIDVDEDPPSDSAADVLVHGAVAARLYLPSSAPRDTVQVVCELIGAAFEKQRTRQLLEARYVSWALVRDGSGGEVRRSVDRDVLEGVTCPETVVRCLARSFHADLARSGFTTGALTIAASELVACTTASLSGSGEPEAGSVAEKPKAATGEVLLGQS
jgi:hypothetical protein